MVNNDDLFDIKMKEKFKKELNTIPENINEEFDNILTIIKNKENKTMNKSVKKKKVGIIAASILCAAAITMQTAFAQEVVDKVIKTLSLNNIKIFENKDSRWQDKEIPETAKGKIFDKNKNVIEKITLDNKDEMYNAEGERVFGVEPNGTLITEKVQRENMERNAKENPVNDLIIKDVSKLNKYTCFDIKLPTYLPEGFKFHNAEFYKDDSGKIFDKACSLNFVNKKTQKTIFISQTYIYKESAAETSFNNIEKAKVNGKDAIIGDEGIVWEANGVRYLMYTDFGKAKNIKIAESFK